MGWTVLNRWWRPLNAGLMAGVMVLLVALGVTGDAPWGWDARAYRPDLGSPYGQWQDVGGAFLYSPAFAQTFGVSAHLLSVPMFVVAWTMACLVVLWWLGGRWAFLLLLAPPLLLEVYMGNIHLLLAAAVVVGFRWPAAWAFPLLTKVTPGVGLLWFAVRREWRALGIALGATAAIAGVSFVIAPDLWRQWIELLIGHAARPAIERDGVLPLGPLWLRLIAAAAIASLGGLMGYRWPVLVASMLAMPVLWVNSLAMLVALIPLVRMDRAEPLPAMWPRLSSRQSMMVTSTD